MLVTKVLKAKIRLFKSKYLDNKRLISDTGELLLKLLLMCFELLLINLSFIIYKNSGLSRLKLKQAALLLITKLFTNKSKQQMKPLKLLILVFFILSSANLSFGQGDAGQAGEFLRWGAGARSLAMGRAFTAVADDPTAIYWNPAGLGQLDQIAFSTMFTNLYYGTNYYYFAGAVPIDLIPSPALNTTFGFGYVGLKTDGFIGRDEFNKHTGTFSNSQSAFFIPAAINWTNSRFNFNFGFNLTAFNHSLQDYNDWGWGGDVGLIVQPLSPLRFSFFNKIPFLQLQHLMAWRFAVNMHFLSSIKLKDEDEDYPNSLRFGISNSSIENLIDPLLDLIIPNKWIRGKPLSKVPMKVLITYDYGKIFYDSNQNFSRPIRNEKRLGGEIRYCFLSGKNDMVGSFRFGHDFSGIKGEENRFTWGCGLKADHEYLRKITVEGLDIDYTFMRHPALDYVHTVSFSFKLGKGKYDVTKIDTAEIKKKNETELLRYLSKSLFDDRVKVDSSCYANYNKIATKLFDIAKAQEDTFLMVRYDEFTKGFAIINGKAKGIIDKFK